MQWNLGGKLSINSELLFTVHFTLIKMLTTTNLEDTMQLAWCVTFMSFKAGRPLL